MAELSESRRVMYSECAGDMLRSFIAKRHLFPPAQAPKLPTNPKEELMTCLLDADKNPTFNHFMNLPPELRCEIYDRVLQTPAKTSIFQVSREIQAEAEPRLYNTVKISFSVFWFVKKGGMNGGKVRWFGHPHFHGWVSDKRTYGNPADILEVDERLKDPQFLAMALKASHFSYMLTPRALDFVEMALDEHRILADMCLILQDSKLKTAEIKVYPTKEDKDYVPARLEERLWPLVLLPAGTEITIKGVDPKVVEWVMEQRAAFQAKKAATFKGVGKMIIEACQLLLELSPTTGCGLEALDSAVAAVDNSLEDFIGHKEWLEEASLDKLANSAKELEDHMAVARKCVADLEDLDEMEIF